MICLPHLTNDHLLDELVFLPQLFATEVCLALQAFILSLLVLQVTVEVMQENIVMAFPCFLLGHTSQPLQIDLRFDVIGPAACFLKLVTQSQ